MFYGSQDFCMETECVEWEYLKKKKKNICFLMTLKMVTEQNTSIEHFVLTSLGYW